MKEIKKILLGLVSIGFASLLSASSVQLQDGWNLIGLNVPMSLDSLKSKIGEQNLLAIQGVGENTTYKITSSSRFNTFQSMILGKGYWIKVTGSKTLEFDAPVFSDSKTISLEKGWNLIAPYTEMSLEELKNKVGEDNLLAVQGVGENTTYKITSSSRFNTFKSFELTKGYWIKVDNSIDLTFDCTLSISAIDNAENEVSKHMTINSRDIEFKVFTNKQITGTSSGTIGIAIVADGVDTEGLLVLNDKYSTGDKFQILAYENGKLVGKSNVITYNGENNIDAGTMTLSTSTGSSDDNPPSPDTGGDDDITPPSTPNI